MKCIVINTTQFNTTQTKDIVWNACKTIQSISLCKARLFGHIILIGANDLEHALLSINECGMVDFSYNNVRVDYNSACLTLSTTK